MTQKTETNMNSKNIAISIMLNIAISVAQFIGGVISGSMALITDATHNFSDVLSLVISYIANKLAKKSANFNHTFGYQRSEILAAFINSITLIVIAIIILINSIELVLKPHKIDSIWVIYLAITSIFVNGFSVLLLKKDAKHNLNMKSAYIHLFSDMITSVGVLVGGIVMKYLEFYSIDALFSILIAIYLLYMSWDIFKSSIKILMQFTPDSINIAEISNKIEQIKGIKNIHHIHIWQINDNDIIFDAHIDLENDMRISDFEKILENITIDLKAYNIFHITIQPEFEYNDTKDKII
jgi:cobalt-zinc-cadmium efflux system protein